MNKIAVAGAAGRMGRMLVQVLFQNSESQLILASEHAGSEFLGIDSGICANIGANQIIISNKLKDTFEVLIDFTRPESTLQNIEFCCQHKKKIIIGTTGFSDIEKKVITKASEKIAIVFSPNMSVGVNLCFNLLEIAAQVMGDYADIEIIESHHRHKIDAPSGTALAMGEVISSTLGRNLDKHGVFSRHGITGERKQTDIGFSTIRAGNIVGEHTAMFVDAGEQIEITHKATSRMNFAKGAVLAANWLSDRDTGLYTMQHVLGFKTV